MVAFQTEVLPGQTVDRFRVDGVLGSGATATVYRVTHVHLGTVHAVKVLATGAPSIHRRLMVEGRAQAALRCAHVVAVSDVLQIQGHLGLVMEYVDGPNLDDVLDRANLTLPQLCDLASGILSGVAAAHEAGIVHRDLKPANVMVDVTGDAPVAKVADFGLAKVLDGEGENANLATRTGATLGTPAYMAPEQIRNAKDVDHRADVFALGTILYELLVGTRPFQGDDMFTVMQSIVEGRYRPVREVAPATPQALASVIERALAADPSERTPSVQSMLLAWDEARRLVGPVQWPTDTMRRMRALAPVMPDVATSGAAPAAPAVSRSEATYDSLVDSRLARDADRSDESSASLQAPTRGRWRPHLGAVALALGLALAAAIMTLRAPSVVAPPAPEPHPIEPTATTPKQLDADAAPVAAEPLPPAPRGAQVASAPRPVTPPAEAHEALTIPQPAPSAPTPDRPVSATPDEVAPIRDLLALPAGAAAEWSAAEPGRAASVVRLIARSWPDEAHQELATRARRRLIEDMNARIGPGLNAVDAMAEQGVLVSFLSSSKYGQAADFKVPLRQRMAQRIPASVRTPSTRSDCSQLAEVVDVVGRPPVSDEQPWIRDACRACDALTGSSVGKCAEL